MILIIYKAFYTNFVYFLKIKKQRHERLLVNYALLQNLSCIFLKNTLILQFLQNYLLVFSLLQYVQEFDAVTLPRVK